MRTLAVARCWVGRISRCPWALAVAASLGIASGASAQLSRVANTTLTLPLTLQTYGYRTENAFPGLIFSQPLGLAVAPGEQDRLFVIEKPGRIQAVTGLATTPAKQLFFDLTSRVLASDSSEEGLLGLAFHPAFATNRYFYVFYTTTTTTSAGGGRHDRLSRFTALSGATNAEILATEVPLISQRDEGSNHNGGDLHFGPDGYLYVALGDEGGGNDTYNNSQRIDRDFFAGLLRIDVDRRAGNPAPNAHASVHAGTYAIPSDNPFVGATTFNGLAVAPASVRTEFWAVGLRNPWRFSFDAPTGRLLLGDVGQGAREEINLITRGGNYGWSYREGTLAGPRANPPAGAVFTDPIWEVDRNSASSITGGVLYRGTRFAQLRGQYVFGDYPSGRIFAMTFPASGPVQVQTLLTDNTPAGFGLDPQNGDVLIASIGTGTIRRLVSDTTPTGAPLPATLTATGAFSSLATLTPAAGVVAYEANVPFWSDHAQKRRWFSVPALANKIVFDADGNWTFPAGTVWVKHFDLELTRGNPATSRRLETRFIVKTADGVYGVTYRWNTQQTEATLVPEEGATQSITINDGGTPRIQTWRYPSRAECLQCHTSVAGHALSFNTAQLNRSTSYGAVSANQLSALATAGYFSSAIPAPTTLRALSRADDAAAPLEHRARSYLAANCVQCHQPAGGTAQGHWDARIATPTAAAGLINGALVDSAGDNANRVIVPGDPAHSMLLTRINHRGPGQMPPIASNEIDAAGVALITSWINASSGEPVITSQPASQATVPGGAVTFTVTATGQPALTYQWKKAGSNVAGATSASYTIPAVTMADAGNYAVTVTSSAGSITSQNATLTVLPARPATFDAVGYLLRNGDVASAIGEVADKLDRAWLHYCLNGVVEGRTDGDFSVTAYLAQYPELAAQFGPDLRGAALHWYTVGRAQGLRIPAGFDVVGYLARHLDLYALFANDKYGAWLHYFNYGVNEGRDFDANFIVDEYLELNPDVKAAFGANRQAAVLHWFQYGHPIEDRMGRVPIGFNVDHYLARYPDLAAVLGGITPRAVRNVTAWHQYLSYGTLESRSDGDFEANAYLAGNPDLAAVYGTDVRGAALHWFFYGRREGRRIPALFDVRAYRTRYPDIVVIFGDDLYGSWLHYLDWGIAEGRIFDDLFRPDEYIALNPDLAPLLGNDREAAVMHWLLYGKAAGRQGRY